MSRRRTIVHRPNVSAVLRATIYALVVLVVFLLGVAVAAPNLRLKRNLFAAALLAAIALLLVCIWLGSTQMEAAHAEAAVARVEVASLREEVRELRAQVAAHVAACDADRDARSMATEFRHIVEKWSA